MKKLKKHKLKFDLTWKYIQNSLREINTLSNELLNLLKFKNGKFFTLLPWNANVERIY